MLDLIDAEARRLYRDVLATGKGPISAPETRRLESIAMNLLRQREANTAAGVKPIDTPETMAAIKATYLAMAAHMAACGSFFDEVAAAYEPQTNASNTLRIWEAIVPDDAFLAAHAAREAARPIDIGMPYLVARRIAAALVAELQRSMGIKGMITESPAAFGSSRYVHVAAPTGNGRERIHVALQVA